MIYLTLMERQFLEELIEDIILEHEEGEDAPIFYPEIADRLYIAKEMLKLPTKKGEDE